jgi:mannose-6-phosphate isomerase-like protein (cupin superfamily)
MTSTRSGCEVVLGRELRATILTTAEESDGRFDLSDCTLLPGARTPLHLHRRYEERFWVLSGEMTVWAGEDTLTLRAGDFYRVRTGVPHAVSAGERGCRALMISSPAGFAELLARSAIPSHLADAQDRFDPEVFAAVSAGLGDEILGPPGSVPADLDGHEPSGR